MAWSNLRRVSKRSASSKFASPRSGRRYSAMRRYRIETSALWPSVSEAAMPNSASAAPSAGVRIRLSGFCPAAIRARAWTRDGRQSALPDVGLIQRGGVRGAAIALQETAIGLQHARRAPKRSAPFRRQPRPERCRPDSHAAARCGRPRYCRRPSVPTSVCRSFSMPAVSRSAAAAQASNSDKVRTVKGPLADSANCLRTSA